MEKVINDLKRVVDGMIGKGGNGKSGIREINWPRPGNWSGEVGRPYIIPV